MTLTTTFVNKTTLAFKLKEGDNGVYKMLCILEGLTHPDAEPSNASKKTLEFDARSTYKEYRVVASSRPAGAKPAPASVKILISSDFIMDNSTIYIVPNATNPQTYVIRGDLRSGTPRLSNFWLVSKLMKLFKRN